MAGSAAKESGSSSGGGVGGGGGDSGNVSSEVKGRGQSKHAMLTVASRSAHMKIKSS